MEKRTDLIYRNYFIPEWDSEMEAFFNAALLEIKRYSRERKYPQWTARVPEISELNGVYEIRVELPGLERESLFVEIIETVVLLSGLRWCRLPNEESRSRREHAGAPERSSCRRIPLPLTGEVTSGQNMEAIADGLSDEKIAERLRVPRTVVRRFKRGRKSSKK